MRFRFRFAAAVFLFAVCGAAAAAPILLPLTVIAIDDSAGFQGDPHVDGDLVTYTSGLGTVRYYDFATAINQAIPTIPGVVDTLSDVSGGRIAFHRFVVGDRTAVMLFDTATPATPPVEVNPVAGSDRLSLGLGGDSLVYSDRGTVGATTHGDIVHFDILTASVTPITADSTTLDFDPRVAPNGDVFVWLRCPGATCEVLQAVRTGMGWATSTVADTGFFGQRTHDTNGTLVVYTAFRPGVSSGLDLFWTPVAGGPEQQLILDGDQHQLSMSRDIVAFEHREVGAFNSDIFLYDLGTGLLYQATDTPSVNETLNDIFVYPDGRINLVWEADDDIDGNIYGAQFRLPAAGVPAPPTLLLLALGLLWLARARQRGAIRVGK